VLLKTDKDHAQMELWRKQICLKNRYAAATTDLCSLGSTTSYRSVELLHVYVAGRAGRDPVRVWPEWPSSAPVEL